MATIIEFPGGRELPGVVPAGVVQDASGRMIEAKEALLAGCETTRAMAAEGVPTWLIAHSLARGALCETLRLQGRSGVREAADALRRAADELDHR